MLSQKLTGRDWLIKLFLVPIGLWLAGATLGCGSVTSSSTASLSTPGLSISAVAASSITSASATITWTTSAPATSQVVYGLTSSYGSSTGADSSMTSSHTQVIVGLQAATTYHFRVDSQNGGSSDVSSQDSTFTTAASDALVVATTWLPSGRQALAYSATLRAKGGTPPYTWSISGALPSSLQLDSSTGVVSGTPSAAQTSSFTVQVADAASRTASESLSIVITVAGSGNLPPGAGWHTLNSTDLFPQYPPASSVDFQVPNTANDGGFFNVFAYSGGVADTNNDRLVIWGGGHNDYCGNEVYALNLDANPPVMQRLNNPSTAHSACQTTGSLYTSNYVEALPATGTFNNFVSCSGAGCRPNARHTLDSVAFIAHANTLLSLGNEVASISGLHSDVPWALDLDALYRGFATGGVSGGDSATNWSRLDTTLATTGAPLSSCCTGWGDMAYDPASHLVWLAHDSLYKYDFDGTAGLGSNAIVQVTADAARDHQMQGVYDPDQNYWWFFGGADAYNTFSCANCGPTNSGVGYWDLGACATATPAAPAHCEFNWVGNNYSYTSGQTTTSHYVPTGCDALYTSQTGNLTYGGLTKNVQGLPYLGSSQNPGVAFDPIWHVIVIWQEPTAAYNVPEALYLFNPDASNTVNINALGVTSIPPRQCSQVDTSTWTETTGPAPRQGSGNSFGVYGRFAYFPTPDVLAVCHGHVDCKILRLRQ